ncbi:hypothetical protein B0A89_14400 (plasmid) [Paracoccus contaminans]|uniref:Peptidase S8/S53 domain-containing protein n=1 Tax=Paracoccus contaminans TaxID=1945662 RepID=A0A1W6D1M4_9RHOB|nr:hypothetical protein B0A89_14400 [Paracoccus contaminans]
MTSADRVARAILWLIPQADLIVMSLGLPADRAPLADACAQTQRAGVAMVASAPARGGPCWPAAYPGVIAASGDARCGWDDLSLLPGRRIGAWCASPEQGAAGMGAAATGGAAMGGASLAAARVAGHLAAHWPEARHHPELWLAARAAHVGAERRGVPA